MTASSDPAAVVAAFVERVAPYDPAPGVPPVALVGVRTAGDEAVFPLSDYVLRAMCEALEGYRDPLDRGTCAGCGGRRLDDNLRCAECGRVHGILGEVIARHAAHGSPA
ncbi:hypothetical protein [Actinoplanes sp. NPDC051494]|uniref:hypothetical protein n=1 Tax=Actinoplanes sp. NPDC051494 TaxID=3363907 RepID=UPI0037A42BAC